MRIHSYFKLKIFPFFKLGQNNLNDPNDARNLNVILSETTTITSNTPPDASATSSLLSGNVMQNPIQQYPNIESNIEQPNRPQENVFIANNMQTIEANMSEHYQQQHHHHHQQQHHHQNTIPNELSSGSNNNNNSPMQSIQYAHVEQNTMNAPNNENGFIMSNSTTQIHPDHHQQQLQHDQTGAVPMVSEQQPILAYQNMNISNDVQQSEEHHQTQIQQQPQLQQQQQQQQLQQQYQNSDSNQQQQIHQISDGGQPWLNSQAIDQNISNESELSQSLAHHPSLSQQSSIATSNNESNMMQPQAQSQAQAQNYSTHQFQIADQTAQLNASTPPSEVAQNVITNSSSVISQPAAIQSQQSTFTQQPQSQLQTQLPTAAAHQNEMDHHQPPPIQSTVANVEHNSNSNIISSGAKATSQQSGGGGEGRTRRSNKSSERIPKLVILSVQNGTLVDCSMESKLKTIKFKFDISDVNPIDVANDLVSFKFQFIDRYGTHTKVYVIFIHKIHLDIKRIAVSKPTQCICRNGEGYCATIKIKSKSNTCTDNHSSSNRQ